MAVFINRKPPIMIQDIQITGRFQNPLQVFQCFAKSVRGNVLKHVNRQYEIHRICLDCTNLREVIKLDSAFVEILALDIFATEIQHSL